MGGAYRGKKVLMIVAWNTAQSIGSVSHHNTDKRIRVIFNARPEGEHGKCARLMSAIVLHTITLAKRHLRKWGGKKILIIVKNLAKILNIEKTIKSDK